MQLDNPLWRYVSTVYSQPNVEIFCLQAQSLGLQVNSLLLCTWLAREHCVYEPSLYTSIDLQWRQPLLQPIRDLRYILRGKRSHHSGLSDCYDAMKHAELELEKVDIALLWTASRDAPKNPTRCSIHSLALNNIQRYQSSLDLKTGDEHLLCCQSLVKAILESC